MLKDDFSYFWLCCCLCWALHKLRVCRTSLRLVVRANLMPIGQCITSMAMKKLGSTMPRQVVIIAAFLP